MVNKLNEYIKKIFKIKENHNIDKKMKEFTIDCQNNILKMNPEIKELTPIFTDAEKDINVSLTNKFKGNLNGKNIIIYHPVSNWGNKLCFKEYESLHFAYFKFFINANDGTYILDKNDIVKILDININKVYSIEDSKWKEIYILTDLNNKSYVYSKGLECVPLDNKFNDLNDIIYDEENKEYKFITNENIFTLSRINIYNTIKKY